MSTARERRLETCLGFFASVIKAGEPWGPTCQSAYEMARVYDEPPMEPGSKPGMIKARAGYEAQHGLNDVFPGDDYPAPRTP